MIRDFFILVSEGLFYIQDGVTLINTPWIFAWVIFWTLIITFPMVYAINVKPSKWAQFMFIMMFFPGLLMAIGPGIVQTTMLEECNNVTVQVKSENGLQSEMQMRECRVKENYYGDFGEWELVGNRK